MNIYLFKTASIFIFLIIIILSCKKESSPLGLSNTDKNDSDSLKWKPTINWIQTNGPQGGSILNVVTNSQGDIFVSTTDGLYRAEEFSGSWLKIFDSYGLLAIDGDNIIYIANGKGLHYSYNNGETWGFTEFDTPHYNILALELNSKNEVFIGTYDNGIFYSKDKGLTLQPLNAPVEGNFYINDMIFDSEDLLYVISLDKVYKSSDNGSNWEKIYEGSTLTELALNSENSLYVINVRGKIFNYHDDSMYVAIPQIKIDGYLYGYGIFFNTNDDLFVGITDGLYRLLARDTVWLKIKDVNPDVYITCSWQDRDGSIYACAHGEAILYRTDDNGISWQSHDFNLVESTVYSLGIHPAGYIFAGTDYRGVFRTKDFGDYWEQVNNGWTIPYVSTIPDAACFVFTSDGKTFAGTSTGGDTPGGVFRSLDNGSSWEYIGLEPYVITSMFLRNNADLFVGCGHQGELFRSSDNGNSWRQINHGFDLAYILSITGNDYGNLYMAGIGWGSDNGVYKSPDNGESWNSTGLSQIIVGILFLDSNGYLYAADDFVSNKNEFFRSIDEGESWQSIGMNLPDGNIQAIAESSIGLFVLVRDYGVYYSSDYGESWADVTYNLAGESFWSIKIASDDQIFIGTSNGVYRSSN